MARQSGTVTEWNDARGFGFITPAGTGRRVFAHVSAFPHGRRPAVGDEVEHDLGSDDRGRTRKQPFRTVFWATVLANCGALVWVAAGMPLGG